MSVALNPAMVECIHMALHALEEANGTKLQDVGKAFSKISRLIPDKLGEEKQKNTILKDLLEVFAAPDLDLKPSRVGSLDVIGNGYEFLIKNFAASGGEKAGEFYLPPEVLTNCISYLFHKKVTVFLTLPVVLVHF